jgi:hypothetical protein
MLPLFTQLLIIMVPQKNFQKKAMRHMFFLFNKMQFFIETLITFMRKFADIWTSKERLIASC